MFYTTRPLILASASPRRHTFLRELGLDFSTSAADIDETPRSQEQPQDFAIRMATEKAAAIALSHPEACVIGADTVVTIAGRILGKPGNKDHALEMLQALCNKTHQVITGLAITCRQKNCALTMAGKTRVSFAAFDDAVLRAYIATGEPMDKAGAYGIQARGAFLVRKIEGSCSNVIGLPVSDCIALLLEKGFIKPLP